MKALKQSTSVVISFGPFLDKTDGVTLETGLVSAIDHASTGIMLSKNGGTLAVRHATVTASTYDAHGCYKVTLDTTDTNTLGRLRMIYTDATTCLPVWDDFVIMAANVYDALVGGGDVLDVSATQFAGQTITCAGGVTVPAATLASTTNITSASGVSLTATTGLGNQTANITGNLSGSVGSVTGAVGSVTGAVGSVTSAVTVGTNNDKTGYALTATTGLGNQTANITGNLSGSVGSVTGAVGSVTGAVGSVTGNVGGNVTGSVGSVAAGGITAASIATGAIDADALAADAVTEIRALVSGTSDSGTTTTMVDAARTEADTDYWAGDVILFTSGNISGQARVITAFDPATDTITFTPATTQAVAAQTYEIIPGARAVLAGITHTSARVPNVTLVDTLTTYTGNTPQTGDTYARLGAPAGASVSADIAAVKSDSAAILVDTGTTLDGRIPAALVGGRMDASVGAMAADTLTASALAADAGAEIADAVWDEAIAGHLAAGSTGNALNSAGSAGDPWSTALPGAYGAGTAGKIVGDNLNATVGSRSSHSAADVWASAARTLTAATNITSTGGTTVPQTGDSFARLGAPAGVSVSADVAAVKADTAATLADTGTDGVVVAAGSKTGYALTAAYDPAKTASQAGDAMALTAGERTTLTAAIWAYVVEGTSTAVQYMRLMAAALFAKLSGAATNTVTIRDVGDTKARITATVDADGNRSAVTTDGT